MRCAAALALIAQVALMPLWEMAVMVAEPSPTQVTTPLLDTVATDGSLLRHSKSEGL